MSEEIRVNTAAVEAREVDGELVILDLEGRQYLGGNRAAAALWPLLVEGATREQLAARLAERFRIEKQPAAADVDEFLASLARLDLLQP